MNADEILQRGRVGRWRVVRLLGEGGFSWVFEVEDENSGKRLALKGLKPEAAEGEQYRRFWREAKILAAQDDPHLVQIVMLDRDEELQLDYYVMELLTGRNLAQRLKEEGRLPESEAIEIILGALQGLARLHALHPPIIHRDIAPPNIQITADGRAKLLDLGVAGKQHSGGDETIAASEFTTFSAFMGRPRYASPEQLQIVELDTSSDVFSMGLCLYEVLEGRHVYADAPDLPTVTYQTVLRFYARLEGSRRELSLDFKRTPKAVQAVVRKALALTPERRYRTAGEMRAALLQAWQGKGETRPRARAAPESGGRREPRARASWPVAAALGVVLALGAGAGAWWLLTREKIPPDKTGEIVEQGGTPPVPPVTKPTDAQQTARAEAADLVGRVQKLRAEGRASAEHADRVAQRLAEGDRLWEAGSYSDSQRPYQDAASQSRQIIKLAESLAESGDLKALKGSTQQARERAKDGGAELSAGEEWSAAEDLLKQAQLAEEENRISDAVAKHRSAGPAYETALAAAQKALAEASAAEKAAQAARAALKGGNCRSLAEARAKGLCEEGARALAGGTEALASKNAPLALSSFQVARTSFQDAQSIEPAPPRPPTLTLDPSGTIRLKPGERRTIQARPKHPEGKPVDVEYTIKEPGGRTRTATGTTFSFESEVEGEHTIQAVAIDAEGARSKSVVLVARVAPAVNAPPTLRLDPSGSLSLKVGESETIRAQASDPEGSDVEVKYTIAEPGGGTRSASGSTLGFRPERDGEYAIEAVAIDADGARSRPERLVVNVTKSEPASVTAVNHPGGSAADVQKTLQDYATAVSNCDLDTLRSIYPGIVPILGRYMEDCTLAATVKPVGDPEFPKSDRARQKISQSIHTVTKEGKRIVLAENLAVAELIQRRDGWYINSIKNN